MEHLYFIRNVGCDDETCGLARISDEDFPKFKKLVDDLNENSTYECKPKIVIYKIVEGLIREATGERDVMYLDGKQYVLATGSIYTYDTSAGCCLVEGAEEVI